MFKNLIKTSVRSIFQNKLHLTINVIGLTIGFVALFFIANYISNELSYDKFNKNYNKIYRLSGDEDIEMPAMYGPMIKNEFPEIKEYARFYIEKAALIYNKEPFYLSDFVYTDNTIFDIFSIEIIQGNADDLKLPFTLFLTESTSKKLFGESNPIGKTIKYENEFLFTVKGIIKDIPQNSHISINALASFVSLKNTWQKNYNVLEDEGNWSFLTYFLLQENTKLPVIDKKINSFLKKREGNDDENFHLQSLKDVYFNNDIATYGCKQGNLQLIWILMASGLFIFIMIIINYIILKTSTDIEKAKEIEIKKVNGASKKHLIIQLLFESIIMSIVAFIFAMELISIIKVTGIVNQFYNYSGILKINTVLILFAGSLSLGLLTGIYPAVYLTSTSPILSLKGSLSKGTKASKIRNMLIAIQFIISILLIDATITTLKQFNYLNNKALGFQKDHVINFNLNTKLYDKINSFKQALLKNPNIVGFSWSNMIPGEFDRKRDITMNNKRYSFYDLRVDPDYLDVMGIELKLGRDFSYDFPSDMNQSFLVNETAVKYFGWKEPIGEKFLNGRVIGVVKDFSFHSLQNKIEPLAISCQKNGSWIANVKLASNDSKKEIMYIKSVWNEFCPESPFEYSFLNETYDLHYKNEKLLSRLMGAFSLICIFISIMGIFGLSLFNIRKKTKEIAIRKVNGAKNGEVVILLLKLFTNKIIIAFVLTFPIFYFVMNEWLKNFAYRVSLNPWIHILSGTILLIITMLTVCWQSWIAAKSNPINSLKYE